jgi:hypothetical protein
MIAWVKRTAGQGNIHYSVLACTDHGTDRVRVLRHETAGGQITADCYACPGNSETSRTLDEIPTVTEAGE